MRRTHRTRAPAVPKLVKEGVRAKLTAAPNLRMASPQSTATWGWGPEADSDRACFQGLRAVWPQGLSFLIWKMGSLTQAAPATHRQKTWAHNSSSHHVSAPVHSGALFENVALGLKRKCFPITHLKQENNLSSHTTKLASTVIP